MGQWVLLGRVSFLYSLPYLSLSKILSHDPWSRFESTSVESFLHVRMNHGSCLGALWEIFISIVVDLFTLYVHEGHIMVVKSGI